MSPATAILETKQSIARVNYEPSLNSRLQAALEHARRLTAMYDVGQIEVAIAWETVEELEVAQRRQQASRPSAFAQYCAANPDAPECRMYDV